MALTLVDQLTLPLSHGNTSACGVACVLSVLRSLGANEESPNKIFRAICAVPRLRILGGSPGNIADYLLSQGRTVSCLNPNDNGSPIAALLAQGLGMSNATKLPSLPIMTAGGPPYLIHFLKIAGINPCGHFVVSDGHDRFMDPGANPARLRNGLPTWAAFYDTGLTVIVS